MIKLFSLTKILWKKANKVIPLVGLLGLSVACTDDGEISYDNDAFEVLNVYSISVQEPSGLAINPSTNTLFTISDNANNVYELSLTGEIVNEYSFTGDDLEGISMFVNNKILMAEERTKEIIEFDLSTEVFTKHEIDYDNNAENSGIEGVTYNPNNNRIYSLNEKNPGLLLTLNTNFQVESQTNLDFASDYSGICYDSNLDMLWIVSDQSKTLNKCSLTGDLIKKYDISIEKAEGIAVTSNRIYIISDAENKLYTFNKPTE